jgi:hypothetical protein
MQRAFVVVSGLPGSGKTTLARRLAPALVLPLIDKDDILDRLFEERGVGDAAWRRSLSRESDRMLQEEAERSDGAVLVSLWHVPGMPKDSGTPTDWLETLSGPLVHVHCTCPLEIAATRFVERRRHAGHLDNQRSYADVLESLRDLHALPPASIGLRIDVDTSREPTDHLVEEIGRFRLR